MMQPQPQSSQQLTLFQVESQVDQYVQYTMVEQANTLARMLARRELPMFYFAEAGEELGITAKTCRAWKMNTWPATNRPSDDKLMYKTAIYLRVYLRLNAYPENETYAQATIRLHRRIEELEEGNFSRNQIAQQMRMSFRTLKDLCDRAEREETGGRSSHCPWKLLERLEDAENEITKQKERQAEFQDLRILHPESNHRETETEPGPPTTQNVIEVRGRCRKCNAGWQSLREDGTDGWNRPVMVCMICGSENIISLEPEDPDSVDLEAPEEEEFIERYAPCRRCQAYWSHMKLERTDRWNNAVYICLRCATVNRARPKRRKTHTIMARAAMLLKSGGSPHTITCLTFSSRGAEDLRRLLENQPLTAAEAPHMFIGTIHHYASFYLRRAGYAELGISPHFTIWDQEQAEEIMTEILDRKRDSKDKASSQEIRTILEWYGKNQTRGIDEAEAPEQAEWVEVIGEYNRQKRENNTLGLEDLIPLAVRAMEANPETRAIWNRTRSRHLLVDEFQDMTPRQYHLMNLMTWPTRSIIATADPNQSINRWKGADPRLLELFQLDHGVKLNTRMLKVNHRGTSTLSEASSMLTKSEKMRGLVYDHQSAIRVEGPRPTLTRFRGTVHEMDRYILSSAEQLVKQGYHWEDMACIYRSHRTMNRMITQFSGKSVPHNILGDTQRDRNSNARCITALLALILNPSDANAFSIAAAADSARRPRRLNQSIADQVRREARAERTNLVEAAEKRIDRLSLGSSNHRNLHYVVNAWRELDRMMDTPGIELYDVCRRANTLLLDARRPGSAATEEPQTFRLMSLSQTTPRMGRENLRQLTARFLELMASAMQPDHQAMENGDPFAHNQGITFGTIHSAKGMQWKIVWVVDATDSDLPHMRWNSGDEELMEEERVFYVAATRATDQLHFCYADPEEKGTEVNPSRFLEVFGDLLESRTVELQTNPIPPGSAWQGTSQPEPEGEPEEEPKYEPEEE